MTEEHARRAVAAVMDYLHDTSHVGDELDTLQDATPTIYEQLIETLVDRVIRA